jgi:hypothetical protein
MTGTIKHTWPALTVCWILLFPWHQAWGLEFSAEQTVRSGQQSVTGKIYFKGDDRMRVEMASPQGPQVAIHRLDKVTTWLLLPNKTYVELPIRIDQILSVAPHIEGEVKRTLVGREEVGGRKTEKYEVMVNVQGRKEMWYQWVATDIKVPMKTVTADGNWESAYTHVKEGPQPAHLFELPAGYTKAPAKR